MLVAVLSLTLLAVSPAAYADENRADDPLTPDQTTEDGEFCPSAQEQGQLLTLASLRITIRCATDIPISSAFAQRPPQQEGDDSRRKWSGMG